MSFVKTQSEPIKFSALLCRSFIHQSTFLEPHNLAPLFYFLDSGTFLDILFTDKHLSGPNCVLERCGIVTHQVMKPYRNKKQTLTFLHAVLPTCEQMAKSSKCPTAPSKNYRIRQSFHRNSHMSETHLPRDRASATQQG